jgi:hypothetical protein
MSRLRARLTLSTCSLSPKENAPLGPNDDATQFFHKNATDSDKQVQFGEANVRLTFHGDDSPPQDLPHTIKMEPDIDYFKDIGAHALLEVLPNALEKLVGQTGLTDPKAVYVLRWIAGRHAGAPEFNPLYTIVPA